MTDVLIGLVGDVLVNRPNPREAFDHVRDVLDAPHILFGNLEGAYTDDPHPVPGVVGGGGAPASYLDVYAEVGFDVMSLANNHILDVGYDAMLATRSRLRDSGVRTCGAGSRLDDAREPAILEVEGRRIAFLGYSSVFPLGYEARATMPGLVPVHAHTSWRDPYPSIHVPGKLPIVTTVPDEDDLARLTEDIERARAAADLVVTSFHWGDYSRPFHLTDHETRTARYSIDAGADLVVGHHHHALRGMEWYHGKPIMYGLGHFVFDLRLPWSEDFERDLSQIVPTRPQDHDYHVFPRQGWPLLPMHEDTRMTVLAWAAAGDDGITDIGFLPCRLTPDGRVHPMRVGEADSDAVVDYLETCNRSQNLAGRITADRPSGVSLGGFETLRVEPLSQWECGSVD